MITPLTHAAASGLETATTAGIDTTGATLLVIGLACPNGYNVTPTDSKGNTWTQLTSYTNNEPRVRLWYSTPVSVGTAHTFTAPGPGLVGTIFAACASGVTVTSPADQQNGANTFAGTLQPGSITPTENDELIIALLAVNGAASPMSIDSGFTELDEVDFGAGDHYGGVMAYLIQTTAAAVNPTFTRTNTNGMAATQASFKATASATNTGFFAAS